MIYYTLNLFVRIFCDQTQVYFRLLLISLLAVKPVQADQDWRCSIDLVFTSKNEGSVANYVLTLQLKNDTGRDITGVSVIYMDSAKEVIGNTLLKCGVNELPVKPGSYGECRRTIQRVDAIYINAFGTEKWTEILNGQLQKLNSINYCHILGFSY